MCENNLVPKVGGHILNIWLWPAEWTLPESKSQLKKSFNTEVKEGRLLVKK